METVKRGRGRPKGSKNKVKKDKVEAEVTTVSDAETKEAGDNDQGGPDSK